jgi:hypothetical protein
LINKKRVSEIGVSPEGWKELGAFLEDLQRGLLIEAAHLAHKEGHELVDKAYMQKVCRRQTLAQSSTVTWFLRAVLPISVTFVALQIGGLASLFLLYQPLLWILPIFVLVLIGVITFVFREYL